MKSFQSKLYFALTVVLLLTFSNTSAQAQDKAAEIDRLMTKLYERGQFNGTVLVADKDKIIYQKAFGYGDFEKKRLLQTDSVFELASISKTFTATAIMILAERGKLKYDDDIKKYFPELPYEGISVRHLLTHTSGLPDYIELFEKEWGSKTKIAENSDVIALLAKHKPSVGFAPGEKWEYSNTAFVLLASIVEKVSGQTFGDFLQANIFKPLDMKNSQIYTRLSKEPIKNYATGYVRTSLLSGEYVLPQTVEGLHIVITLGGIVGDGSVNSTVEDLYKWDRSFYTEKLVKKTTIEEAFTPVKLKNGSAAVMQAGSGYGYGWFIRKGDGDSRVTWHTGGWPGYANFLYRNVTSNQTIVLLSNTQSRAIGRAEQAIENILGGKPYELPKFSIAQALVKTVLAQGGDEAVKLYRELKQNKPNEYLFSPGELNALGYQLLQQKKFKDAIAIFKLNVEEYPKEADPYDSLGEAYMTNGDKELAIKNYEKSLELNPKNQNAVDMLKKLKQQ